MMMFHSIFSDYAMFCGTLCSRNNRICQKNYHWKSNETVLRSKIILKEAVDNTGRKT